MGAPNLYAGIAKEAGLIHIFFSGRQRSSSSTERSQVTLNIFDKLAVIERIIKLPVQKPPVGIKGALIYRVQPMCSHTKDIKSIYR